MSSERITNEKQYRYSVREDDRLTIGGGEIDDPFIVSHIEFHLGRFDAFKALFKPLVKRYRVQVLGTDAAYRVVFQGDYTPPELGPTVYQEAGVN